MAQTVVSKFYSTRKRVKEPIKSIKNAEKEKISELLVKELGAKANSDLKKTAKSKTKSKKVNKVTDYFKNKPDSDKSICKKEEKNEAPRTPKRNLSTPEELTPTKKKPTVPFSVGSSPSKCITREFSTPKKVDSVPCRKLQLGSPNRYVSPKKFGSPLKKDELTPQKVAMYENLTNHDLASIVNESRSKILFSGRLDELKKSLEKFSNVSAKTKEFQANSYKITSVISTGKDSVKESKPLQGVPAYKKFSGLAASQSESSLILPYKYKFLAETFRCLDIVVQMIHNRKERITFEKVQNGVQKMINKNFLMSHLGKIMTVIPTAFSLTYEKVDSYTINKSASPYQLMITPNLFTMEDDPVETSGQKRNMKNTFIYMTPQHILHRKNMFMDNLIKIVKKHHLDFLAKINFPPVYEEKILRWHPKFPLDSVPDIPIAALPEEPEVKVSTAKEVLNKIRGSVRGRVEKALQSVSEEHKNESKEKGSTESDFKKSSEIKKQNPALKGICTDLLEKIRARESAKLIETMTRSVEDEKRIAMLGRIPKIVNILWHYFISERKSAVSVDAAVEKIRHSLSSLSTPDSIKEHLQLIMEVMPGWLTLIKIPRGEYLTMDKKRDITVMLSNLK